MKHAAVGDGGKYLENIIGGSLHHFNNKICVRELLQNIYTHTLTPISKLNTTFCKDINNINYLMTDDTTRKFSIRRSKYTYDTVYDFLEYILIPGKYGDYELDIALYLPNDAPRDTTPRFDSQIYKEELTKGLIKIAMYDMPKLSDEIYESLKDYFKDIFIDDKYILIIHDASVELLYENKLGPSIVPEVGILLNLELINEASIRPGGEEYTEVSKTTKIGKKQDQHKIVK